MGDVLALFKAHTKELPAVKFHIRVAKIQNELETADVAIGMRRNSKTNRFKVRPLANTGSRLGGTSAGGCQADLHG